MENQKLYSAKSADVKVENIVDNSMLIACFVCGRTFNPISLEKHVKICQKVSVKPRNVFDSSKQRLEGIDLSVVIPYNNTSFEYSRGHQNHYNSFVECPYCERKFGFKAADRHINWCKKHKFEEIFSAQETISNEQKEAKERLLIRTQYKAPLPRKSGRENNKMKYSSLVKNEMPAQVNFPQYFSIRNYNQKDKRVSAPMSNKLFKSLSFSGKETTKKAKSKMDILYLFPSNLNKSTMSLKNVSQKIHGNSSYLDHTACQKSESPDSVKCNTYTSAEKQMQDLLDQNIFVDLNETANTSLSISDPLYGLDPIMISYLISPDVIDKWLTNSSDSHDLYDSISQNYEVYSDDKDSEEIDMDLTHSANICHKCKHPYPIESAKYCCHCGLQKLNIMT